MLTNLYTVQYNTMHSCQWHLVTSET